MKTIGPILLRFCVEHSPLNGHQLAISVKVVANRLYERRNAYCY